MKTLFETHFGGRRTITRVAIVDPGASNELETYREPSFSEFSHSLGRKPALSASQESHIGTTPFGFR